MAMFAAANHRRGSMNGRDAFGNGPRTMSFEEEDQARAEYDARHGLSSPLNDGDEGTRRMSDGDFLAQGSGRLPSFARPRPQDLLMDPTAPPTEGQLKLMGTFHRAMSRGRAAGELKSHVGVEESLEMRAFRRFSRVQDQLGKDEKAHKILEKRASQVNLKSTSSVWMSTSMKALHNSRRQSQESGGSGDGEADGAEEPRTLARRLSKALASHASFSHQSPSAVWPQVLEADIEEEDSDLDADSPPPVQQMTRVATIKETQETVRRTPMETEHNERAFGQHHIKTTGWQHHAGELIFAGCKKVNCKWPFAVIDPNGFYKRNWDWLVVLFVLYVAVAVPYEACFLNQSPDWDDPDAKLTLSVVSYALDLIFISDIFLNFRTAVVGAGVTIKDQWVITHTYVQGWFFIDFVASIPFDWFFLGSSGGSELDYVALIKCTRLLRLGRLMRKLEQLAAANLFRIIKMVGAYMLFAHWIACGWYYVGVNGANTMVDGVEEVELNWIKGRVEHLAQSQGEDPEHISLGKYYEMSYYWAITTLTTVGYGDVTPITDLEVQYSIVVQILGSVVFAVIFGNVAVLISSFDAAYSRYRDRMDRVNEFIENNEIPHELRDRMRAYVDYLWNINKGLNVRDMVTELPDALKSDIYLHMYEEMITGVPMFKEADKSLIKSLIVRLRVQVIFPGDLVVAEGDMGREMFFVRHGNVDVISGDMQTTYATLGEGSFFGEISLLTGGRRTATIMATEICEIYSLSKYDFDEVLQDFPDEKAMFREIAQSRLIDNANKRGLGDSDEDDSYYEDSYEGEDEGGDDDPFRETDPSQSGAATGSYLGLETTGLSRIESGKFIMGGIPSATPRGSGGAAPGSGSPSSGSPRLPLTPKSPAHRRRQRRRQTAESLPEDDPLVGIGESDLKAATMRRSIDEGKGGGGRHHSLNIKEGPLDGMEEDMVLRARTQRAMTLPAGAGTTRKGSPPTLDDDPLTRVGAEEIERVKASRGSEGSSGLGPTSPVGSSKGLGRRPGDEVNARGSHRK